jgi:hypothetical protein
MTCLIFQKKYFIIYSVVFLVLSLLFLCDTITESEEKIPDKNDINRPITTTDHDNITFFVNADTFSTNYQKEINFKATTVLIDLYVESYESGNGSIYLINGSDKVLVDYFTDDRTIERYEYHISPQSIIKISLNKFSGKITFRVSKNS